jgi:hypothetical protein
MVPVKTSSKYTTIEQSQQWQPPQEREDHTWCRSLEAHTRVFVERGVISCPAVSQQIEPGQVEQCHDDGHGHDDARDGGRSVPSLSEIA